MKPMRTLDEQAPEKPVRIVNEHLAIELRDHARERRSRVRAAVLDARGRERAEMARGRVRVHTEALNGFSAPGDHVGRAE
jgi:hypothetical protein